MNRAPQTNLPSVEPHRRLYLGWERVLVLGDSHAHVFRHWRFRVHLPRTRFDLTIVGGATVSGLDNPNSKTRARAKFDAALAATKATKIVTLLGEVDTGFVLWYRARKHGQSVDHMLQIALENYEALLDAAAQKAPVVVVSCPLPTIRDGQTWGEVADLRKEVDAPLTVRTQLAVRFNAAVQDLCGRRGWSNINLDRACLDENGAVASRFLNRNPLDHHYSKSAYAALLAPRLAGAFAAIGSRTPSSTTL